MMRLLVCAVAALAFTACQDKATPSDPALAAPLSVTPDNFVRAETDLAFARIQTLAGGPNRFMTIKRPTPLNRQSVVRMNRDTLYGGAVVDTQGGATITVPAAPNGRYVSLHVLDRDHRTQDVFTTPGTYPLTGDSRYLFLIQRIELVEPSDPEDVAIANALQDAFILNTNSAEPFSAPDWDTAAHAALRDDYKAKFLSRVSEQGAGMASRNTDSATTEEARRLAAAGAWGLLPRTDAVYVNSGGRRDANICWRGVFTPPVHDGFWSITVYGADGFLKTEDARLGSRAVTLSPDGTAIVHFGSADICGDVLNRVGTPADWNYLLRIFKPGEGMGGYTLPDLTPVE